MTQTLLPSSAASGRIRTSVILDDGSKIPLSLWLPNLVTFSWGHVVSQLLAGQDEFRIGSMYFEFENTPGLGDPVSVPTLDRSRSVDYYNGLASSPTRDYLRVGLTARSLFNSDESKFPKSNGVSFFARTSGVAGVHGKPFSHNDNSVIFGGSLVSTPDADDATRDVIFSSFYFPPDEQVPKTGSVQFGLDWEITCS